MQGGQSDAEQLAGCRAARQKWLRTHQTRTHNRAEHACHLPSLTEFSGKKTGPKWPELLGRKPMGSSPPGLGGAGGEAGGPFGGEIHSAPAGGDPAFGAVRLERSECQCAERLNDFSLSSKRQVLKRNSSSETASVSPPRGGRGFPSSWEPSSAPLPGSPSSTSRKPVVPVISLPQSWTQAQEWPGVSLVGVGGP